MAKAEAKVTLSLTETAQFRRLVDFLAEVEAHADDVCDVELKAIVRDVLDDLSEMTP